MHAFPCSMFQIPPAKRITGSSPVIYMKAVKNSVEIEGMRNAHLKDAVALCDFLALLEKEVSSYLLVQHPTRIPTRRKSLTSF